jgi:WD40 repeat protein
MLAWARTDAQRHNAIELWDVTTHSMIRTIPTSNGIVRSLAFSSDGRLLASGSAGGAVWVWHVPDGQADRGSPLFLRRDVAINTVAFSPKGLIAFNAATGLLLVGYPVTRKLQPIRASTYPLFAVAFNHDGTRLASGGDDRTIRVWDVETHHLVRALAGHTDAVFALAFSPSSDLLASGSADNSIRIWNPSTGAPIGPALIGHHGYVRTVAFSRDGLTLASGSADGTVKLWDVGGGTRPGRVELEDTLGPIGYVNGVVFSKDGNSLATASRDGAIRLWSPVGLPPTGVTSVVCGLVGDGLTPFERSRYAPGGAYQDPCR